MSVKRTLSFEKWRSAIINHHVTLSGVRGRIMDEFFPDLLQYYDTTRILFAKGAELQAYNAEWQARNARSLEAERRVASAEAAEARDWAEKFEPSFQRLLAKSEIEPVCNPISWIEEASAALWDTGYSDIWLFKGWVYHAENEHSRSRGLYSEEHVKLLVLDLYDRERRRLEKLKRLYSVSADEESSGRRERIPERVRIEVWRREGGKCARCGSREDLEYDHIVPVSKGGSNTARNVELLCQRCNREKSSNIA